MDIRARLLAAFQSEHREHLARIRAVLAQLGPDGPGTGDLDEVLRRAHTLKGAARAVDLRPVELLAHRLETLVSRVRQGTLRFEGPAAALAARTLDAVEDEAAAVLAGGTAPSVPSVLAEIEAFLGIAAEPLPTAAGGAPAGIPAGAETVRVRADSLDRLLRSASVLLAEKVHQDQLQRDVVALERAVAQAERRHAVARRSPAPENLEAVSEHLRAVSRQVRSVRRAQARSRWSLHSLAEQLEDDLRRACMVPAESVFEGFSKLTRDLARDEGKEVEVQLRGLAVEADRAVLQQLKDGLMHALRNAVIHGIEPPENREAQGKSRAGRIELDVQVRSGRLAVRVDDDGRGLDLQGLARVAQRLGLVSEGGERSTEDLLALTFRPGFSTVLRVTELAGRGMGLSVLHEAVSRLQGDVEIKPREGGGTTVLLSVPLSVLSSRVLFMAAGGRTLAVPVHAVARLHRIRLDAVATLGARPTVTLGERRLPLASLAQVVSLEDPAPKARDGRLAVLELRAGGRRGAVAVDAFLDVRDVVIRELGPRVPDRMKRALSGGVLMPDGSVCLVLSPTSLIDALTASLGADARPFAPVREEGEAPEPPLVLVVDDSMTTRTLEKNLLEAHGYRVQVAVDGLDALQRLRSEKTVGVVVIDIQMPRMDGFQLLQEMKGDERLSRIPTILLTSLEQPQDKERGLALGADAYIVKRRFDQRDLLETIEQLL